jgi:hypothetical protein
VLDVPPYCDIAVDVFCCKWTAAGGRADGGFPVLYAPVGDYGGDEEEPACWVYRVSLLIVLFWVTRSYLASLKGKTPIH